MCGLAGFIGPAAPRDDLESIAHRMASAIAHRGPDSSGVWSDPEAGVALSHCRLAIIDVSPAGHQPMISASGRYVLVFNGEIYNHRDLRRDLETAGKAPAWHGLSDTETLLAAIEALGAAAALRKAVGMFALALYDRHLRCITLARDRFGEKPLYYGRAGGVVLFGSELAALRRHPSWSAGIDRTALALLMRYGYVPAPHAIFTGIRKLEPGALLVIGASDAEGAMTHYWSTAREADEAAREPFAGTADEAVTEAGRLVEQAVKGQLIADVPLGAFLSGGIDSSLVVATMQALSPRPVKTFTIGFDAGGYDEARHAADVARHLGTDHTELYLTPRDALDIVPRLPALYSEPFADASQIPTVLVSRLARQSVTVALSGDGGDEVFSGYDRYRMATGLWSRLDRLPQRLRSPAANVVHAVPARLWNALPGGGRNAARARKLASVLAAADTEAAYSALISHWPAPEEIVVGAPSHVAMKHAAAAGSCGVKRMMLADLTGYLPDDVLAKVDRASMSVGLEARVPLLDHRLVAFALRLPNAILRRRGTAKWIARELLATRLPRRLFERPKMGFSVPVAAWLRGPLKGWASDLLDARRLARGGYLRPEPVRAALAEHLSGRADHAARLWNVLMFEAWLDEQGRARS